MNIPGPVRQTPPQVNRHYRFACACPGRGSEAFPFHTETKDCNPVRLVVQEIQK